MAKRMCARPGCGRIATHGAYCAKHAPARRWPKAYDRERGSSAKRGYDQRWRDLRDQVMREQPKCARCGAPSEIVHHVKPIREGGKRLDRANLEAVCAACHNRIHGRDG